MNFINRNGNEIEFNSTNQASSQDFNKAITVLPGAGKSFALQGFITSQLAKRSSKITSPKKGI